MHTVEFTRLLRSAHRASGLTKAELARWFGRNYWTFLRWLEGSSPVQNREQVEARLLLLIEAINEGMLPLSDNIHLKDRDRAIGKALNAIKHHKRMAAHHMDRTT